MSEKKILKRDVKAVWARVKRLRADHAKNYAPERIEAAADQLDQTAQKLRTLAKQLSALSAMPPDARPVRKEKRAVKPTTSEDKVAGAD